MLFRKKFKINGVTLLYGKYYPSGNHNIVDPIYWFRKTNYKIYDGEELIEKGIFKNAKELLESDKYIPFSKTNITKTKQDFIQKYCPEAQSEIEQIIKSEEDIDFDIAFRIFIEVHPLKDEWDNYVSDRLEKDIIKWCEKNNIPYVIKY